MFDDEYDEVQVPAPRPRRQNALRRAAVATALMGAVVAGGYGVASAQTDETPSTEETPSTVAPDDGTTTPDPDRTCDHADEGTADPGSSSSSSSSSADASL